MKIPTDSNSWTVWIVARRLGLSQKMTQYSLGKHQSRTKSSDGHFLADRFCSHKHRIGELSGTLLDLARALERTVPA
jgi:hypothetical protein